MTTNSRLAQYQSTKSAELPSYEGAEIRPYLQRINPVNTDEWGWAIPAEQALAAGFDSSAEWEIKEIEVGGKLQLFYLNQQPSFLILGWDKKLLVWKKDGEEEDSKSTLEHYHPDSYRVGVDTTVRRYLLLPVCPKEKRVLAEKPFKFSANKTFRKPFEDAVRNFQLNYEAIARQEKKALLALDPTIQFPIHIGLAIFKPEGACEWAISNASGKKSKAFFVRKSALITSENFSEMVFEPFDGDYPVIVEAMKLSQNWLRPPAESQSVVLESRLLRAKPEPYYLPEDESSEEIPY